MQLTEIDVYIIRSISWYNKVYQIFIAERHSSTIQLYRLETGSMGDKYLHFPKKKLSRKICSSDKRNFIGGFSIDLSEKAVDYYREQLGLIGITELVVKYKI